MRRVALALFFPLPLVVAAQEFTIESKDLTPITEAAASLVSKSQTVYEKEEFKKCTLVGKPIIQPNLWFITVTGCPVGNAAGPIWITLQESGQTRIILETGGYSLKVDRNQNHGLPNLTISSSTAAIYIDSLWQYNGNKYIEGKARIVDLNNAASCKENPEICSH